MGRFKQVFVILFVMNAVLFFSGYGQFEDDMNTMLGATETTAEEASSLGTGTGFSLDINFIISIIDSITGFFSVPYAILSNPDLPAAARTIVGGVYLALVGFGVVELVTNR